jgi:nitrile hydratase subunit alpha
MTTTRRELLATALTAAGVGVAPKLGEAKEPDQAHDHDHQAVPSDPALRAKALESVLVARGLIDRAALDVLVDAYEHQIGPRNGARVVAHAWADEAYRKRLLSNGTGAIAELGYGGEEGEHMVVVENTPRVHNLVVCTLCSCYPWPVLGLPPVWYKSAAYRSRSVIDPRGVLKEFGVDLPPDVEVRVWDSTAEVRYLVLPERPAGTEKLSEDALAALVSRDAMVGVARVAPPPAARA